MSSTTRTAQLLEELDTFMDTLDLDTRDLQDQLSLLACKIDDVHGLTMELEGQHDVIRTHADALQDNQRRIAEILETLGRHVLIEDDSDEEQPAA